MASALLACHPQGAVPAMPGQLPALDHDLVETAIHARVSDLNACLVDTDVVPGQRTTQRAAMQLSITESGVAHSVTVQNVDDADVNECIVRKVSEWRFPRGGMTTVKVELRVDARSAELAALRLVPFTQTADSSQH